MSPTPRIDVRPQVQLSLGKSFRFCRKGISYRLFRSALTLAVVAVAVAFFMVLLSEGVVVRAVRHGVNGEVRRMRAADALLTHLFLPHSTGALSGKFAAARDDPERLRELARVAGLPEEAAARLADRCDVEQRCLLFFERLPVGKRVVLVQKNRGRDIFVYLQDPSAWEDFLERLGNMRSVRLPVDPPAFRAFLDDYPAFLETLASARAGWLKTVSGLEEELAVLTGGDDVAAWMAGASEADVERWRQAVTARGFILEPQTMAETRDSLTVSAWENEIARALQTPEKRAAWKRQFFDTPVLEEKMLLLGDPRAAEVLGADVTEQQRADVSARYARRAYLRKIVGRLPFQRPGTPEPRFLDGRQMFLVIISFLVCMIGIANAMLMAITERFREIATMKCLGATDGFILKQFLIEAAVQGVVGGVLGMLIGLVITLIKGTLTLGGSVYTYFPSGPILWCSLFTVAAGILLAMLASVYPSRAAARMAPMDAMRVE